MEVIVITGTPCSGKTTLAEKAAMRFEDLELIHVNDLIRARHLFSSKAPDGSMVVKMGALQREIARIIGRSSSRRILLEGHILCDLRIKGATAIVVREHLGVLIRRMKARSYDARKIKDNIVAEAIDYCGQNASANYRKSIEIFNDRKALATVTRIIRTGRLPRQKRIELLPELARLMKSRKWSGA